MIDKLIAIERKVQTFHAGEMTMEQKRRVIQELVLRYPDAYRIIDDMYDWWNWDEEAVQLDPNRRVTAVVDGERKSLIAKYNGRFITRLKKLYRLACDSAGDDVHWSAIGNIYTANRPVIETIYFDVTRGPFDWQDGDFGDSGSCYWGGRSICRYILEEHEAWAVRIWDSAERDPSAGYEGGMGRAWLIPWMLDNNDPALILYNGYRRFEDEHNRHNDNISEWFTRWLSSYLATSWRRISLRNKGNWDATFYINSGSGYLISDLANHDGTPSRIDLNWEERATRPCASCRGRFDQDSMYSLYSLSRDPFGGLDALQRQSVTVCYDCYCEGGSECILCGYRYTNESMTERSGLHVCLRCAASAVECHGCGTLVRRNAGYRAAHSDNVYCHNCSFTHLVRCAVCDETNEVSTMRYIIGRHYVCQNCGDSRNFTCPGCQRNFVSGSWAIDGGLCLDCYADREVGNDRL